MGKKEIIAILRDYKNTYAEKYGYKLWAFSVRSLAIRVVKTATLISVSRP